MWDADLPPSENVELLVEKLLEEEVARLMAENDAGDDEGQDGGCLDGGEELVGGIDDHPSESDGLGLNKAKATVLAGAKITSQPQEKPLFNQINANPAANNGRNNAYGKRYVDNFADDDFDDDFGESTDRAAGESKRN